MMTRARRRPFALGRTESSERRPAEPERGIPGPRQTDGPLSGLRTGRDRRRATGARSANLAKQAPGPAGATMRQSPVRHASRRGAKPHRHRSTDRHAAHRTGPRLFQNRVEHRPEIAERGIDDPQNFASRGLLGERLVELAAQLGVFLFEALDSLVIRRRHCRAARKVLTARRVPDGARVWIWGGKLAYGATLGSNVSDDAALR